MARGEEARRSNFIRSGSSKPHHSSEYGGVASAASSIHHWEDLQLRQQGHTYLRDGPAERASYCGGRSLSRGHQHHHWDRVKQPLALAQRPHQRVRHHRGSSLDHRGGAQESHHLVGLPRSTTISSPSIRRHCIIGSTPEIASSVQKPVSPAIWGGEYLPKCGNPRKTRSAPSRSRSRRHTLITSPLHHQHQSPTTWRQYASDSREDTKPSATAQALLAPTSQGGTFRPF